MVNQIYLAKIYFTDLSSYKIRPVLVIKMIDDDCICLQLTSQDKPNGIRLTNNDLINGKLQKDSLVVVPKNFTLHKQILYKYIGEISNVKALEIYDIFCNSIGCKK